MSKSSHAFAGAFEIVNGEPVITIRIDRESIEQMAEYAFEEEMPITIKTWKKIVKAIDENDLVGEFMNKVFDVVEDEMNNPVLRINNK